MKRNHWFVFLLVVIFLFSCSLFVSSPPEAETILKFGYIADAPPVSVKDTREFGQERVLGYCGKLKSDLEEKSGYSFDLVKVPYEKRFKRYENISVECGPNSIIPDREENLKKFKGQFSEPFFDTYTKLLINQEKSDDFKEDSSSIKIGIIGNTTSGRIENIYTNATPTEIEDRGDAIKELKTGEIDAFANDEILLESIQKQLKKEFPELQFAIFPECGVGFGFETYGVVVYDDDALSNQVNFWINSETGKAAKNSMSTSINERET